MGEGVDESRLESAREEALDFRFADVLLLPHDRAHLPGTRPRTAGPLPCERRHHGAQSRGGRPWSHRDFSLADRNLSTAKQTLRAAAFSGLGAALPRILGFAC